MKIKKYLISDKVCDSFAFVKNMLIFDEYVHVFEMMLMIKVLKTKHVACFYFNQMLDIRLTHLTLFGLMTQKL